MTDTPQPAQEESPLPPDPWWRRAVFAIGLVAMVIGLGLVIVPRNTCDEQEATGPRHCSTAPIREQGAVLVAIGAAGIWVGRQSLAARRRSSAWDRSWR